MNTYNNLYRVTPEQTYKCALLDEINPSRMENKKDRIKLVLNYNCIYLGCRNERLDCIQKLSILTFGAVCMLFENRIENFVKNYIFNELKGLFYFIFLFRHKKFEYDVKDI